MKDISRLQTFLQVSKNLSFAEAGRCLGISSPAVTKQIQALEKELGVKLFYRSTRQVSLTEQGAIYAEKVRKALDDLQEAEREIVELKDCPRGKLKINAPMSFGRQYLAKPLAQFARQYPEIEMEVDFDDRWVDVIEEGYDMAVRIGILEDSSLVARKLSDCPIRLYASPEFIEQRGKPKSIEDVANFPAVLYTKQNQSSVWLYEDANSSKGSVVMQRALAANTAEMQLQACLEGVGIAVIPIFAAAPHLANGSLVPLLPEYQMSPKREIYTLFPQRRYLSTKVRLLVDYLLEQSQGFSWVENPR